MGDGLSPEQLKNIHRQMILPPVFNGSFRTDFNESESNRQIEEYIC